MERQTHNPWTWQDQFGFAQSVDVTGAERVVYFAGQASVDPDGRPLHAGDMNAQVGQALDNLESVLEQAGLSLANVVRVNWYVTDVEAFFPAHELIVERYDRAGIRPASTLLGITRLAFPELMIELEATAVA